MTTSAADHDVRHDRAGWGGGIGRPRLTCFTPQCDGATLVAQPYMTQEVWNAKVAEYLAAHPCSILRPADHDGRSLRWDGTSLSPIPEGEPK